MADLPLNGPLDPVEVDGTEITFDQYVDDPTVITRTIAEYALRKDFMSRIFTTGGEVTGGAILFERPNTQATDLFASRDVQEIAPGTVFPKLTFERGVPMVALPRKIGGKFDVDKETRKRNRDAVRLVDRGIRMIGNTIQRKLELMALAELNAVITSESRTDSSVSWADAAALTQQNRTGVLEPIASFTDAQEVVDLEERGVVLNGMVTHPTDWSNLSKYYGPNGVAEALRSVGITEWFVTPRHANDGSATLYEAGRVGEWRNEFPLNERTWEDDETDGTWNYQASVSPAFAVDDPFAVLRLTGLRA